MLFTPSLLQAASATHLNSHVLTTWIYRAGYANWCVMCSGKLARILHVVVAETPA